MGKNEDQIARLLIENQILQEEKLQEQKALLLERQEKVAKASEQSINYLSEQGIEDIDLAVLKTWVRAGEDIDLGSLK